MTPRLPVTLFVLLVAALTVQTVVLVSRSRAQSVVPIVLPYRLEDLRESGPPAPPGPPPPGGKPVLPLAGRAPAPSGDRGAQPSGPRMTTDDVVRGLHGLNDAPEASLRLTPDQRRRLLPLVREAAARKERLHALRRLEEQLQQTLAEKGVEVLQALTPAQREALLSNRDETEQLLRDLPGLRASGTSPAP